MYIYQVFAFLGSPPKFLKVAIIFLGKGPRIPLDIENKWRGSEEGTIFGLELFLKITGNHRKQLLTP